MIISRIKEFDAIKFSIEAETEIPDHNYWGRYRKWKLRATINVSATGSDEVYQHIINNG